MSKADNLSECGWASSNQLKALTEKDQVPWEKKEFCQQTIFGLELFPRPPAYSFHCGFWTCQDFITVWASPLKSLSLSLHIYATHSLCSPAESWLIQPQSQGVSGKFTLSLADSAVTAAKYCMMAEPTVSCPKETVLSKTGRQPVDHTLLIWFSFNSAWVDYILCWQTFLVPCKFDLGCLTLVSAGFPSNTTWMICARRVQPAGPECGMEVLTRRRCCPVPLWVALEWAMTKARPIKTYPEGTPGWSSG